MDKEAISKCSEEDLVKLGLKEVGHIVCLKSFCASTNHSQRKQVLAELIKGAGKERTRPGTKKRKFKKGTCKTITIGCMDYNDKESRCVCATKRWRCTLCDSVK